MALNFTKTGDGTCDIQGSGRNLHITYEMSGSGTREVDGTWALLLVRTPVEAEQTSLVAAASLGGRGMKTCPSCRAVLPSRKDWCDCGAPLTAATRLEAAWGAHEAAPNNPEFAAAYQALVDPSASPWLTDCTAPAELRQLVLDGDYRRALAYIAEHYVDERHGVPAQMIYSGKHLRKCRLTGSGGVGLHTFGAPSASLAVRRAAFQGLANLLADLMDMENTDAFKKMPKAIRRGARSALRQSSHSQVLERCPTSVFLVG